VGLFFQQRLRVGDTTPGAALLYANHPYNVAFAKVNEHFIGASQLVVIAEGTSYCSVNGAPCVGDACTVCYPEVEEEAHRAGVVGGLRKVLPGPLQRLTGIATPPAACAAGQQCLQREGGIKNAETLNDLDLFARHMAERPEVGGTVTAGTLLKK